jgi:DNA-binding NarL/FixJ family response regulator
MRIAIADDNEEVRSALRLVLEGSKGWEITGEFASLDEVLPHISEATPDVLLLDWELGRSVAQQALVTTLRKTHPTLTIIGMSAHPESRLSAQALGIDFFLSKGDSSARLLSLLARSR